MTPSQIKGLQRALNAAGFVGADGQPLAVDGDIGPNTEAAIQSALAAAGTVNAASPSELIRAVQGSLNAAGATDKNGQPLKVDGRFGPLTESALQKVAPNDPVNVNPGELAMRQMPESDLSRPLDMSPPGAMGVPPVGIGYIEGSLPTQEESDRRIEDYRESERGKAFSALPPPPSAEPPLRLDLSSPFNGPPAAGINYVEAVLPTQEESDRRMEDYRESERAKAFSAMPPPIDPWGAGSEVQAHPLDRARIAQAGAPEPPLDLRYAAMAKNMALFKEEMKRREEAKHQTAALNKRRNAGAIDYSPLR